MLRLSREIRRRAHDVAAGSIGVTEAMLHYWVGRWDEALTALAPVADDPCGSFYPGLHRGGPALLRRGVTALIAVRRDDRALAEAHLRSDPDAPADRSTDEDSEGFLLAARAVHADEGRTGTGRRPARHDAAAPPRLRDGPPPPVVRGPDPDGVDRHGLLDRTAALERTRVWTEAEKTPGRAATMRQPAWASPPRTPGRCAQPCQHYRSAGPGTELART